MKKIQLLVLIMFVMFVTVGCTNNDNNNTTQDGAEMTSILMDENTVSKNVKGLAVYTNPQFRYEIRHSKSWEYHVDDEGEKIVVFHPKRKQLSDDYFGLMIFQGITNWKNNYTLKEYYSTEALNNYYGLGFEIEKLEIKGHEAVWFKDVDGLYGEQKVQIIGISLEDRILEVHLFEQSEDVLTALNSIKFY